jgi:hypothetical protein
MGLDEEFVKICLKKMKASASRVESLNSYNIDPHYRDEVKKDIAVEIKKQIEEYVKTFDLLDKYFSDEKHYEDPIPSVKSIEKTMWRKTIQNNKILNTTKLEKKLNEEERLTNSNGIIKNIEKREEDISKINIEFDSIEELISDLEEKENSTQQKLNIEYDTIDYIINDLEKDSTSTGLKFDKEYKEPVLKDEEIIDESDEIEYLLNFYKKSINYNNSINEKSENNAEDSIENFVNTYLILKNRKDLIKDRYTPSNKEIDDFVIIYQMLKSYKENADGILLENQQIKKTEFSEEKVEIISENDKILCPKCRNFVSFKDVCEICGYKFIINKDLYNEESKKEDLKNVIVNEEKITDESIEIQNEIGAEDLHSEILDQIKQNNFQSIISEKQKSEYSQIEHLALNIFSTYMDNFVLMSGIISSTSGLYLIFSQLLFSNGSNLNAVMNVIISITDLLPGIFIPLYDLTLYNPNIIGIILSIMGLNLILIIIGLRKGYQYFRSIGTVTLLISIYFDVIRIMSTEYLITSWSIIGIIPNIIVLYYFFNRNIYYIRSEYR